ncbi:high nitrogen upregulated cytochrome P450 monooxygenase 2 [Trametes meyenii]|nr:high nitrogen upregulated cytochrome P450 monooxygenase 2 [Trametes meyenii]
MGWSAASLPAMHGCQPPQVYRLLIIGAMGLIGHQAFRRLETFSILLHVSVLAVPSGIGVALLSPTVPVLRAICLSTSIYTTALIISTLVYRASPSHPLARYPGPVWCKLSKFRMAWVSLSGRQHTYIRSLHEKYGDVVRTGPNELSIRDVSVVHAMLGPAGLSHGPMFVGKVLRRSPKDMLLVGIMDTAEHLERRKPWARAFSGAALKEYEPLVAARASQLVQALEHQQGEIDMGKWVNFFSFGGGSELLRDGDTNNFWRLLDNGLPPGTFLSHVPWLAPYLARVPFISADIKKVIAYCNDLTTKRIARGSEKKDLFHYLSNEDQPGGETPPVMRLIDDGVVAIVAGADTTSSALTSIFFSLVTHSDAYRRLEEEIDRFYPPGHDPCDTRYHREMHYLTAVINEAMRIYPPVPSGSQRQVPHSANGVYLGSIYLPPGTIALLHTYSIHRDPRNFFPSPEAFWPERWLLASGRLSFGEAGPADKATFIHNEAAFLPFSYGPMNCVGKNLAMLEMRVIVCAVMQKFKLRLRDGWDVQTYQQGFKDFFVTTRPPVPVQLAPRL